MPEVNTHSEVEYPTTSNQNHRKDKERQPAKRVDLISLRIVRESSPSILYQKRVIRSAEDAAELLRPHLEDRDREHFLCVHLTTKHEVASLILCSVGSPDASIVHPRDVLKAACISNASAIICAHNHSSGDPTPSNEDVSVTRRLKDAATLLGIDFLDHLVIGSGGRFTSLRAEGLV